MEKELIKSTDIHIDRYDNDDGEQSIGKQYR